MRPICGLSSCAARLRILNALAPLLVASTGVPATKSREGAPGSPNPSPWPPAPPLAPRKIHPLVPEYVSLDLETTGLDPARDRVIQVGAVRFTPERTVATL